MRIALLRLSLAVVFLSLTLVVDFFAAPSPPIVVERDIKAELSLTGISISMPIRNPGAAQNASLNLEIINSGNEVVAAQSEAILLRNGDTVINVRLKWDEIAETEPTDRADLLLWKRLRYRLQTEASRYAEAHDISGTRSLGEMLKELFTIRVVAPEAAPQGTPAHVRVFVEHPLTHKPAAGVQIEAFAYEDEKNRGEIRRTVTQADGSATVDVLSPRNPDNDREFDCKLKVIAASGLLKSEQEDEITFRRQSAAIITTDKPLYQPGQTLHIRSLVYDPYSHRPLKNEHLTLQIEDEESKTVFEKRLTTDRFGVAFADWLIPATSPLGRYEIRTEGEDDNDFRGGTVVRVSRYELPTFVVNVEPDKTFYLPGEDARVKVSASFVYGEPVKIGHIRVAREEEREWNYQKQTWEVKEGSVWESDSDKDGAFTPVISLKEEQENFEASDYREFEDVQYVARYTEAASGRSEERRFKLRLSKEAIHVYTFSTDERQSAALPLHLFVVANYADGTPAMVDLSIKANTSDDEQAQTIFTTATQTDRHGIALIERAAMPNDVEKIYLSLAAKDAKGATGAASEELSLSESDVLRLRTDRALYHRGEPLKVEIQSSVAEIPRLVVELFADNRLIRSQTVAVRDGRAEATFAPNQDLQGRITIYAYDPDEESRHYWRRERSATRRVLYPKRRTLAVNARFEREAVKPGEAARAFFTSLAPDGRGRETSLGVVVYDTAVEERERTESESGQGRNYFGSYYGSFYGWGAALSDVSLRELEQLDDTQPFPADLELIADAILQRTGDYYDYRFLATHINGSTVRSTYGELLDPLASMFNFVLSKQTVASFPRTQESLNRLLGLYGIDFDRLRDLWGNAYRVKFDVNGKNYRVRVSSDGPDEQPDTADDFMLTENEHTFWEAKYESEIVSAIDRFKSRKGRYPQNVAEIIGELTFYKSAFLQATDAWGKPYELRYEPSRHRSVYQLQVVSAGSNGKFEKAGNDLTMMTIERDWFAEMREKIRSVLVARFSQTQEFPTNEAEFVAALKAGKIDYPNLRDPWEQPLTVWFTESARYSTRARIERVAATPNAPAVDKTIIEPITQYLKIIQLGVSVKPSLATFFAGIKEPLLFSLGAYDQVVREESRDDAIKALNVPAAPGEAKQKKRLVPAGLAGAIIGIVTDAAGAIVANATVTLTNTTSGAILTTQTDNEGYYAFLNLSAGRYSIRIASPGFKDSVVDSIEVRLSMTTRIDMTLEAGGVTETVTVTGTRAELVQTENASVASVTRHSAPMAEQRANRASTPRLRQDFPETLVWQPALVTDSRGNADLKFHVADSITTWRMAVIASTEDGLIGSATADLRAFQPFFVEHQPPPSLTIGDEIETPVVVRNYQERAADVNVKLAPAAWMQIFGSPEQTIHAAANAAATAPIRFKALAAGDFKQEASAIGASDGDRVAKAIAVRFDGRDTFATYADLFQRQTAIDFIVPDEAIQQSARAELKIYPDLFAHAVEGIEGIVQRPHGCAEQTTSSGYPNLIVLQYLKSAGRAMPALEKRATENLNEAIARLRSFITPSGGFGYFDGSSADAALTAYVLRFLSEAADFVPVREEMIEGARRFLAHEQKADGSWGWYRYGNADSSGEEAARLTALIVRSLAMSQKPNVQPASQGNVPDDARQALAKGLDFLSRATRQRDDAYALALTIIAAQQAGRTAAARESAEQLIKLAQPASGAIFWGTTSCTPFYGWGRAGNIETTGLAVEALTMVSKQNAKTGTLQTGKAVMARNPLPASGATRTEIDEEFGRTARKGLLYIIRNKDEYGVWYSTQATVNALHAIVSSTSGEDMTRREALKIAVSIDSAAPRMVDVPINEGSPKIVDLNAIVQQARLTPGKHRLTLSADSGRTLSAAVFARATLPWSDKDERGLSEDGGLRLRVSFDKTQAKPGEVVSCRVHAERVAQGSYGMMLLEVGLPPGVDVDTESLRRASVSKFDATPDRVVFYLWSQAGGTDFTFTFRPRLRIDAKAQPSVLYDYYNPDARVSLAPVRFVVQ